MQNVGWTREAPDLFTARLGRAGPNRHYLVVEALPLGEGWDWAAWRSDGSGSCIHGRALRPEDAMRAARNAAALLCAGGRPHAVDAPDASLH